MQGVSAVQEARIAERFGARWFERKSTEQLRHELSATKDDKQSSLVVLCEWVWLGCLEQVLEVLGANDSLNDPCFDILHASLLIRLGYTKEATERIELLQKSKIVAAKVLCAMVPFLWNERSTAVDMLYKVLDALQDEGRLEDIYGTPLDDKGAKEWTKRLTGLLVTCYTTTNDYSLAMDLCDKALRTTEQENRVSILLQLARIRLQIGDVDAARVIVQDIKAYHPRTQVEIWATDLLEGIVEYADANFSTAQGIFQSLLDAQIGEQYDHQDMVVNALCGCFASQTPFFVTLSNNLALCHLNLSNLGKAVETLEACIRVHPFRHLTRTVVFNLCTLYDLAKPQEASQQSKDDLRQLAQVLGIAGRFSQSTDFRL